MPLQTYTTLIGATSPSPVTYTVEARAYAHEVYGDETDEAIENEKAIILDSDILASYLSIVLGDDETGHVAKYVDEPQGEAEQ